MEVSAGDVFRSGASESPRTLDPVSNTQTHPSESLRSACCHPSVQDPHEKKNCAADPGLSSSSSSVLIMNHVTNYIYIYAFSRRFYPKRLTVHSGYTCFISMCVPWESNPQPFALLTQCSTTEPQEHN